MKVLIASCIIIHIEISPQERFCGLWSRDFEAFKGDRGAKSCISSEENMVQFSYDFKGVPCMDNLAWSQRQGKVQADLLNVHYFCMSVCISFYLCKILFIFWQNQCFQSKEHLRISIVYLTNSPYFSSKWPYFTLKWHQSMHTQMNGEHRGATGWDFFQP